MALEDMISGMDVSIVGTMTEIEGEQFETIKKYANKIQEETGLKVGVFCFHANYHQAIELPVMHNDKIIGYETRKDGEVIAMRGVNELRGEKCTTPKSEEWNFCPNCGTNWTADCTEFGCWVCGTERSQNKL